MEVFHFFMKNTFSKEVFSSIKEKVFTCNVDSTTSFSFKIREKLSVEACEYEMPRKLIAISDVEGQFYEFKQLLIKNKVMDENYNWTFEKGHLVLNGDFFDRGEHVTECLWLVYKLEQEAQKKGGKVHFILGNHDIMNMYGNTKYVREKYLLNAKQMGVEYNDCYSPETELGRWLQTKNIMEKIGDYLFVHAGISPELLNTKLSIKEINEIPRPHYFSVNKLGKLDNPNLEILLSSKLSPYWYRGIARNEISQPELEKILRHFNVSKMVIGHTVVKNITYLYNRKVINIDTKHAQGNSQGLLIKNKNEYKIDLSGKRNPLK